MSKFTLQWEECHDPLNWGKTEKAGIKALKETFATKKVYLDPNGDDGWVVCECEYVTKTLKEAIKLAKLHCIGNGVDVFSICKDDDYSKAVFTEENL